MLTCDPGMGLGGRDAGGTTCRHVAHEWKPARMRSQKRSIHGWCLCELQSGDCRVAPLQQPPVLPKRLLLCRHQLDCEVLHVKESGDKRNVRRARSYTPCNRFRRNSSEFPVATLEAVKCEVTRQTAARDANSKRFETFEV